MDWVDCTPQHQAAWSVQKPMWAVIRQWAIESALKDGTVQPPKSLAKCLEIKTYKTIHPSCWFISDFFVSLPFVYSLILSSSINAVHSSSFPCTRIFGFVPTFGFSAFLDRQMRCAKWRCEGRRLSWLRSDVGHHRPWMHFAKRGFRSYITRLIHSVCFHCLSDSIW